MFRLCSAYSVNNFGIVLLIYYCACLFKDVVFQAEEEEGSFAVAPSVAPEWAWFGRDCSGLVVGSHRTTLIPPHYIDKNRLPSTLINGVKSFTIFVGFGRGGTTLVGALLDGHPNIVLGTDYQLFIKWPQERSYHQDAANLYTALYRYSRFFARYFRKNKAKGYSFDLKGGFNGRYSNSISVIGEKEAGSATVLYMNEHHQWMRTIRELQETVKVPIKAVQVRNMTIICSVVFVSARFSVCVNLNCWRRIVQLLFHATTY